MSPTVDVYAFDLVAAAVEPPGLDRSLPVHERDAPTAARQVRVATRRLLGARLGLDPGSVPVTRECEHCGHPTHGRPRLRGVAGPAFGASHSGSFALVAIAEETDAIGVDLEVIRLRADLDALAARVLGADALTAWRLGPGATALERFLGAWTAKEAYLKATGIGIATDLRSVPDEPMGWWVAPIAAPVGCVAAIARRGSGPVGIRSHRAGTVMT